MTDIVDRLKEIAILDEDQCDKDTVALLGAKEIENLRNTIVDRERQIRKLSKIIAKQEENKGEYSGGMKFG